MKYYIPTSSLNLDNILQAESISPRSFYAQRKTGYTSIELIDEMKVYDQIVLFNHPILFSIDDPGRYNYPLLIEIEDDTQLKDIHDIGKSGMYLCGHTLHLTPQNCRFYFFTEQAYKLTIVNTKDNKSIKYYEKYSISPSASSLKLSPLKIEQVSTDAASNNSNETEIDKQKGVCYAFLRGQLLSVTPDLARQIRLTQELYNTLTMLISSPQKKDAFLSKLETSLKEYKKIDPTELDNKEKFKANIDKDLGIFKRFKKHLQELLEKWGVWNYVYGTLSHKWGYNLLPNTEELSSSQDFSELRNEIENRTCKTLKEYQKKQPLPSLGAISINNNVFEIKDMPIVNQTVNYIIRNQLTVSSLSADRQGVCKDLIKDIVIEEIKRIKGEKYWDSSIEKKYFNNLYAHIGDLGKSFDLKEVDSPELIAIAAFLLRGDNINDLMAYLKLNEICDYRYTLALWGALCGYVEMNKEFLSDILNLDNYKDVYKCLFHYPMGEMKQEERNEETKKDPQGIIEESRDSTDKDLLLEFIKKIDSCKLSSKHSEQIKEAFEKNEYQVSPKLFISIDKIKGIGKRKLQKIKEALGYTEEGKVVEKAKDKNKKQNEEREQQPSQQQGNISFADSPGKEFYKDSNAFDLIEPVLPADKKIKNQVKKDLDWFQENHIEYYVDKKNEKKNGIYFGKPTDNRSVIERFNNYLGNKRTQKDSGATSMQWLRDIYKQIDIEEIILKLKKSYFDEQ